MTCTAVALPLSLLMTGALCGAAATAMGVPASNTPSAIESGVDANIQPGDDFFAYANGAWLKSTEIPPGKDRWGARDEISARTQAQLANLFKDAALRPRSPYERKVGDFYAAT